MKIPAIVQSICAHTPVNIITLTFNCWNRYPNMKFYLQFLIEFCNISFKIIMSQLFIWSFRRPCQKLLSFFRIEAQLFMIFPNNTRQLSYQPDIFFLLFFRQSCLFVFLLASWFRRFSSSVSRTRGYKGKGAAITVKGYESQIGRCRMTYVTGDEIFCLHPGHQVPLTFFPTKY